MRLDEYQREDALGLATLVRRGELAPHEPTEAALSLIARDNPRLNAVVADLEPRARARLARGIDLRAPFAGVPFLIKDLVTPMAGLPDTGGSRARKHYVAPTDAPILAHWEAAGLVPVGKTNTPEFGLAPVTQSALFGPCRNPWNPALNTGGSSGGSAAGAAAGWVPMAHGNDGGGSIRIPAGLCGLLGFKPSLGRNRWEDFSQVWNGAVVSGVLSRSVRDAAVYLDWLFRAASTHDPAYDPAAPPADSLLAACARPPAGTRIALCCEPGLGAAPAADARAAARATAQALAALGHEVEEAQPDIDWLALFRAFSAIVCAFTREDAQHASALTGVPLQALTLELPTRYLVACAPAITPARLASARETWARAREAMLAFHARYPVWLTPVASFTRLAHDAYQLGAIEALLARLLLATRLAPFAYRQPLVDPVIRRELGRIPFTPIANVCGAPSVSVPGYFDAEGLPVGALLTAAPGADALLIGLAAQLEAARPWAQAYPFLRVHEND